jgi:hypothetical protein
MFDKILCHVACAQPMVHRCVVWYHLTNDVQDSGIPVWNGINFTSSPTTTFWTRQRNQPQLPLFSFSTMANARSTNWRFASMPIAMSNVPSYFLVKNVPSIDKTLQQYLKASMHYPNVQNAQKKYYLPLGPRISCLWMYQKCIPELFAFIACNMVDKRS